MPDRRRRGGAFARDGAGAARATTVASIRHTGMIRKHGHDKVSRTNRTREISMPNISQFRRPPRRSTRQSPLARSFDRKQALCASPHPGAVWRTIPAAIIRITVRLATCVGTASTNLPFAVASWVISEFIAGCAAYSEAMYFTSIIAEDRAASREPAPVSSSREASSDRRAKPFLTLVSGRERLGDRALLRRDIEAADSPEARRARCDRGLQR
jgi:hypothetical protein